jgi:hypothetical protein
VRSVRLSLPTGTNVELCARNVDPIFAKTIAKLVIAAVIPSVRTPPTKTAVLIAVAGIFVLSE